jgi:hypothetical protein
MSTGAGYAGVGSSRVGFGTPTMINSSTAKVYIKADGTQGNCAMIDPLTGDYVLDDYGNSVGDDSVNQMVYLAFKTLFNSSAVDGFGLDIDVTNSVINDNTNLKVKLAVMKAVKHLTSARVISIVSVTTQRITSTGLQVLIQWMNLSTGEINELTF